MEKIVYSFEKLNVWQISRKFVASCYKLLENYPAYENYALCNQIRRACISIVSNIAEGSSRTSSKEQAHFIEIAYGSLMEVYCQLQLSVDLGYIQQEDLDDLKNDIDTIAKMLTNLRAHFFKTTHSNETTTKQLNN